MSSSRLVVAAIVATAVGCSPSAPGRVESSSGSALLQPLDPTIVEQGKAIFRYTTFGNETFWSDTLRLHEVIRSAVSPAMALKVGLKVDLDSLPVSMRQALAAGKVDLNSPATTVALLTLGAIVGVVGHVDANTNTLMRVGITCALCHSTVDNSFAPGIGRRLDGWPNQTLDPGAIIALSPALTAKQRAVYTSWGAGRYDPRYNRDGSSAAVLIPPAYGLRGVNSVTATGDGTEIAYWNRYVAVTQMHGHGTFTEPRLSLDVRNGPDQVAPLLAALQAYQLSLSAPPPVTGTFDTAAAERGRAVFDGAGKCASCHSGALLTDANERLHPPSDVVSEPEPNGAPSYAARSATKQYRTTPLRALALHPPYFHNGVAATLDAVVELYNTRKGLNLSAAQRADLVQFLKSR